jgi:hypothetical protein
MSGRVCGFRLVTTPYAAEDKDLVHGLVAAMTWSTPIGASSTHPIFSAGSPGMRKRSGYDPTL